MPALPEPDLSERLWGKSPYDRTPAAGALNGRSGRFKFSPDECENSGRVARLSSLDN